MGEIVTLQTTSTAFPEGGVNDSAVTQKFADSVIEDLGTLATSANANSSEISILGNTILEEVEHVKNNINALNLKQDFRERNADNLILSVNLYNKKNFSYAEGSSPINRLVLDQRNGLIYLPTTTSTPLFFNEDATTGDVLVNSSLDVRVASISEGVSGSYQPVVTPGNINNAFNGFNTSYWSRKISYPMEAPVTEVEVEVEITIPAGSPKEFNTFSLAPHALGRTDIMGVWYKSREEAPWTILEEFPQELPSQATEFVPVPIREASNQKWIGQVRPVVAFKVRLKQRDWSINNNKKVFVYGAQEISASLVRFSNANTIAPFDTPNNAHIIYKISAPESTSFGAITKIDISPDAKTEGSIVEDNHVLYQLSKTPAPVSTDIIWNSASSALPQNGNVTALDNLKEYYLIISMKYVNQITKDLSVFKNGTSPIVNHVNIVHTLVADEDAAGDQQAIDWSTRNASTHFQNIMMMDAYRGSIEDGSNSFIIWDDNWEDPDWRTAVESSLSNIIIDKSRMALTVETDVPSFVGTIAYVPLTDAEWGTGLLPRRFRLQTAISNQDSSKVDFHVKYELNNAPQPVIDILHGSSLVPSKGSVDWMDFPNSDPDAVGYIGDVTSISVTATLTNGVSAGARPYLYQFALIVKD